MEPFIAFWLLLHCIIKFPAEDESGLLPLASGLDVSFETTEHGVRVILEGEDVSDTIRTEEVGATASKIAALPSIREALLRRQRGFKQAPRFSG